MQYWLMKSEPEEFSFEELQRRGTEPWTGVRNYQARNFLRQCALGDQVLFYHSNCPEPGIVGVAKIVATATPDPTQFQKNSDYFDPKSTPDNPRWSAVQVGFDFAFKQLVSLPLLRETKGLEELLILRPGNRLSVTPVSLAHFKLIVKLGTTSRK
jgi:predicted RNA-binding protein with PUA-like domain